MYAKKYLRLLVIVASFIIILIVMITSSDYPLSDLYYSNAPLFNLKSSSFPMSPPTNQLTSLSNKESNIISSPQHSSNLISKILPSFLKNSKTNNKLSSFNFNFKNPINSFPLNSTLLKDSFYTITSLSTYTDPFKVINDKSTDYQFVKQDVCRNIKYTGDFKISPQQFLEADFNKIQWALSQNQEYAKIIQDAKQRFKPTIPDRKQWFRFGGSSVWLPEYDLHYMVSRVLYTPSGIPNKSFVSFLYIQLFDKNWIELPSKKLKIPYQQNVIQNVLNTDGSVTQVILDKTIAIREVEYPSFLPIPIEYLMETENGKYYWGPEDPRILPRLNPLGFYEPIIVFNMKSVKLVKRVMHLYLPFNHDLKVLKKRNEPWAKVEKNWTPFISETNNTSTLDDDLYNPHTNTNTNTNEINHKSINQKINFMYSVDPLEILSCDINSGICDFVQKQEKNNLDYFGLLRGGTQLIKLPFDNLIPQHILDEFKLPQNRKIYIGWARAHLNECGCGESMYRPNLIILIEDFNPLTGKFYYKIGDVSEYFDFDANIPAWSTPKLNNAGELIEEKESEKDKNQCSGRNVLIPNSIAYWNIESIIKDGVSYPRKFYNKIPTNEQLDDIKAMKVHKFENNQKLKKRLNPVTDSRYPIQFNDYMGVTLSAADSDVSIVHVRGLLNYIINLPTLYDESTVVQDDSMFEPRGQKFNYECAMDGSWDYCVNYAKNHGGLTVYPPKDEKKN